MLNTLTVVTVARCAPTVRGFVNSLKKMPVSTLRVVNQSSLTMVYIR